MQKNVIKDVEPNSQTMLQKRQELVECVNREIALNETNPRRQLELLALKWYLVGECSKEETAFYCFIVRTALLTSKDNIKLLNGCGVRTFKGKKGKITTYKLEIKQNLPSEYVDILGCMWSEIKSD